MKPHFHILFIICLDVWISSQPEPYDVLAFKKGIDVTLLKLSTTSMLVSLSFHILPPFFPSFVQDVHSIQQVLP